MSSEASGLNSCRSGMGRRGLEKAEVLGKGTSEEGSVAPPSQGFPSTNCPKPACALSCAQPLCWGSSKTEQGFPRDLSRCFGKTQGQTLAQASVLGSNRSSSLPQPLQAAIAGCTLSPRPHTEGHTGSPTRVLQLYLNETIHV